MITTLRVIFLSIVSSLSAFGQETFIDPRDNNEYPIVQIGNYQWFGTNLRFLTPDSWCAQNSHVEPCSQSNFYFHSDLQQLCPTGWRIPTWEDWKNTLEIINQSDSLVVEITELPYTNYRIIAERVIKENVLQDTAYLNLNPLGWIQGKKWVMQPDQANLWVTESHATGPPPHLHVRDSSILKHAHEHHIWDKPKKQRRFAVRCIKCIDE
ncbi:MAG: FISUMP domain-containing protein [Bacteroidota bacterium]